MKEQIGWPTLFLALTLMTILLAPASVRPAPSVSNLSISIPGEKTSQAPFKIVRGIIHNISFAESPVSGNTTLRMYYGTTPLSSENRSDTSLYQWSYNASTGVWEDDLYRRFINTSASVASADSLSFHVGIAITAYVGLWTLTVVKDGSTVLNESVTVTDYTVGLALQSVNTVFTISPFSSESKTSEYHVRVENKGNIPLRLSVLFGKYQSLFSVNNLSEPLHVGETRDFYVTLNSIPWSPRVVNNITGVVHPEVPAYLTSSQGVSFATTADQTFNLRIEVVREGYNLVMVGNTGVQYRDSITANYGRDVSVDLYLSSLNSSGSADLKITSDLMDILSVTVDNRSSGTDMSIQLSNETERHVRIIARPNQPSTTAYLNYDIRDSLTGNRTVLKTEVVVLNEVPEESGLSGIILLLVGVVMALFIISIIFITFIHFRKEGQRKKVKASSKSKRRRRKI